MTKLIPEIKYMNPVSGSIASGEEWMDDQKEFGFPLGVGFPLKDLETLVPNRIEETALYFINCHKNSNLEDWFLQNNDLTGVYNNLVAGEFGETRQVDLENYPNDYEIEISSVESATGNAIIFEFEHADAAYQLSPTIYI